MLENIDLADTEGVRALLQRHRPDEIYHLAAFHHSSQDVSVSKLVEGKDAMIRTNFLTTKTLAFALAELGSSAHLVLASSSQIYTAREGASSGRRDHVARAGDVLRACEVVEHGPARVHARESAIRASSAILFNHESPRRGVQFVSRKITRAAALASTGAHPELHVRDVGARVDWSSARDVVQAMSLMGAAPDARDYVIASGQPHSVRDLLSVAFDKVGLDWREFTRFDADTSGPASSARRARSSTRWAGGARSRSRPWSARWSKTTSPITQAPPFRSTDHVSRDLAASRLSHVECGLRARSKAVARAWRLTHRQYSPEIAFAARPGMRATQRALRT
jgi:GDPmannose 4,6-dehydratase